MGDGSPPRLWRRRLWAMDADGDRRRPAVRDDGRRRRWAIVDDGDRDNDDGGWRLTLTATTADDEDDRRQQRRRERRRATSTTIAAAMAIATAAPADAILNAGICVGERVGRLRRLVAFFCWPWVAWRSWLHEGTSVSCSVCVWFCLPGEGRTGPRMLQVPRAAHEHQYTRQWSSPPFALTITCPLNASSMNVVHDICRCFEVDGLAISEAPGHDG